MIADLKLSPANILKWSHMEDWVSGASSAPTEHTLSGAGASIARESTTVKSGTYSAAVTRSGADATLYHDSPEYEDYLGRRMTLGCWVYASVASRARISLGDGVGTTNSSYHSGVAGWEFLTVTRDIDASATRLRCGMEVNTGNTTAYFDGMVLFEGESAFLDVSEYFESWKPSQKIRMPNFVAARRAGLIIPSTQYGEKGISITGKVYGTTYTNARTNFDAFVKACCFKERDLYLYDDRFNRGYLQTIDHEYIAALRVIKFTAKFICQNPFTHYLQRYRTQQAISSSPTSFNVTNNGNVRIRPDIRFVAGGSDITDLTLENLTTGQTFSFSDDVSAGETLQVDCQNLRVENNAVDSLSAFVGDFLYLEPGTNVFKFTGSNCTIKVDTWDNWL